MILTSSVLLMLTIGVVEPYPFNFNGQVPTFGLNQPLMVAPPLHPQFYHNFQDSIIPLNSNAQRTYAHQQQFHQQHQAQQLQQPLLPPVSLMQRFNLPYNNLNQQKRPVITNHKSSQQQFYEPTQQQGAQQGRFAHPLNNQQIAKTNPTSSSNDFLASLQIIDTNGKLRQLKEFGLGGHGSQPFEPELERHLRTIFDTINRDLEHADFLPLDVNGANNQLSKIFQQQQYTPNVPSAPHSTPIVQQQQQQNQQQHQQQQQHSKGAIDPPKTQQALGYAFTQEKQHQFQFLKPRRANNEIPKSEAPVRSPVQIAREPKKIEQRPVEAPQLPVKAPQVQTQTTQQFEEKLIQSLPTQTPKQDYREQEPKGKRLDSAQRAIVQQKESNDQFQAPIEEQQQQQQFIPSAPIEQRSTQAPISNDQQLGFDDEPVPLKTVERSPVPKLQSITQPRNEEQAVKSNLRGEEIPSKGPVVDEAPVAQQQQSEEYHGKKLGGWTPIVQDNQQRTQQRQASAVKGRKTFTKSGEHKKGFLIKPAQRFEQQQQQQQQQQPQPQPQPQQNQYPQRQKERQVSKFQVSQREQIEQSQQQEEPLIQQVQQILQGDVTQQQRETSVPSLSRPIEQFPVQQQQQQRQQQQGPSFFQQQREEQTPTQDREEAPLIEQQQEQNIFPQQEPQQSRRQPQDEQFQIQQQREEPIQQKQEEFFDQRQEVQDQIRQDRQEVSQIREDQPTQQRQEGAPQLQQQQERVEEPAQQRQEQQQQQEEVSSATTAAPTTTTITTVVTTTRLRPVTKGRPVAQQKESKVRSPVKTKSQSPPKANAPVQWAIEDPVEQERQTPQQQQEIVSQQPQQQREDNTPVSLVGQEDQASTTSRTDLTDTDQVTSQPADQETTSQVQRGREPQVVVSQQEEAPVQQIKQVQQEDETFSTVSTERPEQQLEGFKTEQQAEEKGATQKQVSPDQPVKLNQSDEQAEQVDLENKQQEAEPSQTTTTTTARPEPVKGKQQANGRSRLATQRARSQPPKSPVREALPEQKTQNQQEEEVEPTITTTTSRPRFVTKGRKSKQGNTFRSRPQVSNDPSFGYSSQQNVNSFSNEGSLSAQQLLNTYNPLQFEPERISSIKTQQGSSQNSNVNSSSSEESY